MKILNVNMSLDPETGGGASERTIQLSREMAKLGMQVSVLTLDIGVTEELKKKLRDVNLVALPCLSRRFYFPRFSVREVRKLIQDADVVNLMTHWTFINALAYYLARAAGTPYTVCPAGALPVYGRSRIIKQAYNSIIGRKMISNADGCIAISVNESPQFKEYGVAEERISLIPNGVNPDDFNLAGDLDFRKKFNLPDNPYLLFVGRLNSIKGPDLLLKAFHGIGSEFGDYHLVFVGPDGGLLGELRELAHELGVEGKVHFLGHLGGENKTAAYRAAELLVIPSRQEAMSIVVLEAGICGIPVLLTDQCGFASVADVGGGGVVAPSVEGLREGLISLLGDRAKLRSMGANLREFVQKNYTWRIAAQKYAELFKTIAAAHRRK